MRGLIVVTSILLIVGYSLCQSVQEKSPSANTQQTGCGICPSWSNIDRIYANDTSYASVRIQFSSVAAAQLTLSGFGFTIPSVATITGLTVTVLRFANDNPSFDAILRFSVGGNLTTEFCGGRCSPDMGNSQNSAAAGSTYGSASNLGVFGLNGITPDLINAASFGVVYSVNSQRSNVDIYVDNLIVRAYYTLPEGYITSSQLEEQNSSDAAIIAVVVILVIVCCVALVGIFVFLKMKKPHVLTNAKTKVVGTFQKLKPTPKEKKQPDAVNIETGNATNEQSNNAQNDANNNNSNNNVEQPKKERPPPPSLTPIVSPSGGGDNYRDTLVLIQEQKDSKKEKTDKKKEEKERKEREAQEKKEREAQAKAEKEEKAKLEKEEQKKKKAPTTAWSAAGSGSYVAPESPQSSGMSLNMSVKALPEKANYAHGGQSYGKNVLFGVPLALSRMDGSIPIIVSDTVAFLGGRTSEEGILRLAGNTQETKKLKTAYNAGERPDLSLFDTNVVGDILKSYLRELPIGLLMMTTGLKAAGENGDVDLLARELKSIPDVHQVTIQLLFGLLYQIVQNESINKMGVNNLAIVFRPTLKLPDNLIVLMIERYPDMAQLLGW